MNVLVFHFGNLAAPAWKTDTVKNYINFPNNINIKIKHFKEVFSYLIRLKAKYFVSCDYAWC